MEPTIQDIVGMRPDPELGTGTPAVVYDSKDLVHTLNQAAQQKAENDWRKYNMFMTNLKEVYKDLDEIAKQPVLTEDRDKLKKTMAEIVKGISSDPRGFFSGGPKYQETLGKLTQLQSETTESKQNNLYDAAHRQYFYANPELDTPDNRALVDSYRKGQLGARSPYMLKLPGIFDPKVLSDQLKLSSMSETATETPDGKGHTNKIVTQEVDPAAWEKNAKAFYYSADKRGNPVIETVKKQYEQLPASVKAKYTNSTDPVFDYYTDLLSAYKPMPKVTQTLETDQPWITNVTEAGATKRTGMQISSNQELARKARIHDLTTKGGLELYRPGLRIRNPVVLEKDEIRFGVPLKKGDTVMEERDPTDNDFFIDQDGTKYLKTERYDAQLAALKQKGVGKPAGIMGGDPLQFWDEKLLPKIKGPGGGFLIKDKNGGDIPAGFTGTKDIDPTDVIGLNDILGEHIYDGDKTDAVNKLQIKFKDGEVVGIIIDGHALDKDEVNAKVTDFQNRSMSNPRDNRTYQSQ